MVHSVHAWIFSVEPGPLDICLLLGVIFLGVNFSYEVGDKLNALVFEGSDLATCLLVVSFLELLDSLSCAFLAFVTEEFIVSSGEVSCVMAGRESVNDRSKATLGASNWSTTSCITRSVLTQPKRVLQCCTC